MDVTEILQAHEAKFEPINVEKLVPLDYDLNLLAGFDTNAIDEKILKSKNNANKYLLDLTRGNAQLIVNELFKLPMSSADAGVLAELPTRTSTLPREKPLPKEKPLTKWEKFAKVKGIQNRKKDRMAYDEATGKYVPRWGYKPKEKGELDQDWLIPVPDNADPLEDQYEKRNEAKKAKKTSKKT